MGNKHNNLKRIFHRFIEEVHSTYLVSRETSMLNFIIIFRAKILNYKLNKSGVTEKTRDIECLQQKHKILMEYFERRYRQFCENYKYDENSVPKSSNYRNKIWICWWQGVEQAPVIVQKCISSICRNASPYEVIVLNDTNYRQYANIPDWLEEKRRKGIITRTHFSDFLRMELLAEHGGIWFDATLFVKNFEVSQIANLPVWSIKRPGYGHLSVACGNFANYSLGCNFENRKAFAIIRDYLIEYWRTSDSMIDYLFMDYLIELALRHDIYLKTIFDMIPDNNPKCDELQKVLGDKYDFQKWKALLEKTSLFKLSWKQEYPIKVNGRDTFYGMIIKNSL